MRCCVTTAMLAYRIILNRVCIRCQIAHKLSAEHQMPELASCILCCRTCCHSATCCMQRWLQHFAWTESSQTSRMEQRNRMLKPEHRQLLEQEPLFCFETAVKLLYWCGFVYEYDEVCPCAATKLLRVCSFTFRSSPGFLAGQFQLHCSHCMEVWLPTPKYF